MKLAKWSAVAVAVVLFVACRGHEQTVAGGYGMSSVNGQVVMASGATPAGVSVTVRGTGQTTILGEDGRFSFTGVPENVQLIFTRADGINATFSAGKSTSVVVELSANSAAAHGRSRSAPSTPHSEFEGLVKSVSATQLVITDSHRGDVTFTLDANTVVRKGDLTVAPADLVAGDRVHVRANKQADNSYLALLVLVQNTEAQHETSEFEGTVKAITADSLTLNSRGGDVVLQIDASTTFTPAAPVVGDRVHVRARKSGDALVALSVRVQAEGEDEGDDGGEHHGGTTMTANGKVTAAGASELTVESESHGSVTVTIDSHTLIKKQGVHIAAGDIKTGDYVNTRGTRIDDHSLLAEQIEVRGEGGHH
jgi:hypothetical protein